MDNGKKQMYLLLSKNKKSVLFLRSFKPQLSRSLLNKLKSSDYEGDRKFFDNLTKRTLPYDEDATTKEKENEEEAPVVIKRVREQSNIATTLQQVWRPFMSMQADVAEFKFTNPSASDPSYVLVCVDLFTQKIFTYGYRTKNLLPKALEKFLDDIENDRSFFVKHDLHDYKYLRLQTDEEFTMNNKIKTLCEARKVNLYTTYINGGHASAAEQKIKLLKERMTAYLQSNNFIKSNKGKILADITDNINSQRVEKYGFSPNKLLETFRRNPIEIENYNAYRLTRVDKAAERRSRMLEKKVRSRTTRLRKLVLNDLVYIPKGRLKKQDYPGRLDKVTTNKKPFFHNSIIFRVTNIFETDKKTTLHQVKPITKIPKLEYIGNQKFTRDELYALKNNTVSHVVYNKK